MPLAPASATRAPGASGCLFVLAAPSGGGKTSLVAAVLERESGISLSVSYTTRAPRPGEVEGVHYHFVDSARFMALKEAGEFLEYAHVHGNWYATSANWLRQHPMKQTNPSLFRQTTNPYSQCLLLFYVQSR